VRYTVTNPIEGQYFFACECTCSGRSHPSASSMMRTTAARDCVSRYPALFKSVIICIDGFDFVIMKIIINNDTIRMAAGVKSEVMSWGLHRVLVAVKSGV